MPAGWTRNRVVPHRWRATGGVIVDVVPATDELLRRGRVSWPDGSELDLTGIDVAMADVEVGAGELPDNVGIVSLRALCVCKIAAWLDRPGNRLRDLGDLAAILDAYVDDLSPRVFDDPRIEPNREFDERPALLLVLNLTLANPRRRGMGRGQTAAACHSADTGTAVSRSPNPKLAAPS
jgi:predicted nucleotidyltransferase